MARLIPALAVLAVLLAFAPSLQGEWVWDDRYQLAANAALDEPLRLLVEDVWSPTGQTRSDLYRPLGMLSYLPVHLLGWGPAGARGVSLALHLLALLLGVGIARRLGASTTLAWGLAATAALHTGVSEAVCWPSARHDLLPSALVLGAWLAWLDKRALLAGGLLALAPWCKESYLLVPGIALLWAWGSERRDLRLLVPPVLGVGLYLGARVLLEIPLPVGATGADPLGGVGALVARLGMLLVLPSSADACFLYEAMPKLGALALLGLGLGCLASRGRPALAGWLGALFLALPGASASAHNGMVGDRYLYLPLFLGIVCLAPVLEGLRGRTRLGWALALVPLLLLPLTHQRSGEWANDATVFQASLDRNPTNPHAAFHRGHQLQVEEGDCERAIPLYRLGTAVEARAGNNLQGCLLETGRLTEAAGMGEELAARSPGSATPCANTARALAALDRYPEAEPWALEATRRQPGRASHWILLGNVRGRLGQFPAAAHAFGKALELRPDDAQAKRGLQLSRSRQEGARAEEGGPTTP